MIVSVILMTVTDIGADLISVYVFDAGMFGIGLASSLSYLAAFLVELGFFLKKDGLFRFRSKRSAGEPPWRSYGTAAPC